jgi:hypothetical protein
MAKFTDKDMANHSLIKSKELQGCMMCKEPTPYIEFICEGRLCSEECQDAFYKMMDDSTPDM